MKEVYRSPSFSLSGYIAYTVKYKDGSKYTVLEHREIIEKSIRRRLRSNEIVHHKDGNKKNNVLENLEITTKSVHMSKHQSHRVIEWFDLVCLHCGKKFVRRAKDERANRKRGKKGTYCSRKCARQAQIQGKV